MTYETILVQKNAATLTVTINRPQVMNALNEQVLKELNAVLDNRELIRDLRAFVIAGAGEKSFIAGADIAAMSKLTGVGALQFARLGQGLTRRLEECPFLTIAKVQGYALGGGCELAMACDIVVASENALFGQPEVDLGLIPGFGGTQRLAKRVGLPLAMEILCAGRKLNGREAQALGLVSTVTPAAELDAALEKILKNVNRAAPGAIAETKRLARASLEQSLALGLESEATTFAACFAGEEAAEGTKAFLEKRKANFSV